jgi:hypothetical protein
LSCSHEPHFEAGEVARINVLLKRLVVVAAAAAAAAALLYKIQPYISNAAEEEIASRSEAISDGAERVLNFSILYTHPPTHPHILPYIKHY